MATANKNSPMAAVGSYESILPFKAIGLDVVVINDENRGSLPHILNKFARSGYAALFVEESLFAAHQELVDEVNETTDMCIIPVPNQSGSMGVGLDSIRKNVERAVGMDIFGAK
jgi:V/A-type H+-transporting ATPase subunit F